MTRALLTTCGRNISPLPKRSPTIFMPSISGPSITSSGRLYFWRASSVSASTCATMPFTSAWDRRSSTLPLRQSLASSAVFFSAAAGTASAPELRNFSRISGFFSAVARSKRVRSVSMPLTIAALMRSSGVPAPRVTLPFLIASACSISFSVASSWRLSRTSSTRVLRVGSISA